MLTNKTQTTSLKSKKIEMANIPYSSEFSAPSSSLSSIIVSCEEKKMLQVRMNLCRTV